MKLIVGLGNPGKEYQKNRHNLGFMAIDALAGRLGLLDSFKVEKKFNAEIVKDGETIYAKPQTFMNKSGEAVQKIARYYKVDPENITIIHDDKDMELGKVRIRDKGSSGGHKGIESIIQALGTENFTRIKMGVAGKRKIDDTSKYILKNFSLLEKKKVRGMINQVVTEIKERIE